MRFKKNSVWESKCQYFRARGRAEAKWKGDRGSLEIMLSKPR